MTTFTAPHPLTAAMQQATAPLGLLPYLDAAFGATWEHLQVKNFGFQQPNTFDPTRNSVGWRSPDGNSEPQNVSIRVYKETIELGKIFPVASNTDGTAPLDVSYQVEQAILTWLNCYAGAFRLVSEPGKLTVGKQRRIWANPKVPGERWHILMWTIDIEVYG